MLPACAVETSGILSGPTDDDLKWPWPWLWKNVAWNFDELSGSLLCLSSLCDQWDSGYGPRIRSVRTWIAVELPAAVGHVIRRGGRGAKGYPGFPAALGKMSSLSKSRPTWPGWPGWPGWPDIQRRYLRLGSPNTLPEEPGGLVEAYRRTTP